MNKTDLINYKGRRCSKMLNDGQKRQLAEMHNMCEELTMMYQTAQQNDAPGDVLNEILKLRNKIRLRRDELSRMYMEIDGNGNL